MQLVIDKLSKRYGSNTILDAIDLQVEAGQIACLLGASGCGKTTLLRCIAGFESLDTGAIELDGIRVSDANQFVPPERRAVGMVFQDHALFPHLNVSQNAGFGLHQWTKHDRSARINEVLELVGLATMGKYFPHQLSGGQQQRAALARALANKPRLLLMDEPFASLDRDLRYRLAPEIAAILRHSGTSALWVTHDQTEAMNIADVIGVIQRGKIVQWASPQDLFHRPVNRFVAEFLGECAFLRGTVTEHGTIDTVLGELPQRTIDEVAQAAQNPTIERAMSDALVDVLVRPDQLISDNQTGIIGRVSTSRFNGIEIIYELILSNQEKVKIVLPSERVYQGGEQLKIRWNGSDALVFPSREAE